MASYSNVPGFARNAQHVMPGLPRPGSGSQHVMPGLPSSSATSAPGASIGSGSTGTGGGMAMAGFPNYLEEKEKCLHFLRNYVDSLSGARKYEDMLQEVADRQRTTVTIALDDVLSFENDEDFVRNVMRNTRRYVSLFSDAVDDILPPPSRDISEAHDVLDVLRLHRVQEAATENDAPVDLATVFPPALMRRFELQLVPGVKTKPVPIREVKASKVGSLVRIKGMVTRVSNVKPLVIVATYTCEVCSFEVYQEVKSRNFNPLVQCPSEKCKVNKTNGRLLMQTKASKFQKFQEVKFQELPDQVPMGHIPRSLTVYLRGELTRSCEPGALITICGIFLPLPYSPQRQMQVGLITETYLEAMHVINHKKRYSAMDASEDMETEVERLQESPELYSILSQSIAPEIYGHEDVKKALLLLMIGGVTKRMDEGMKVRGDINVLLMGDPGVAKSQLLKHIATVSPRGIYTTGKGSSGVGLTAAVVRDQITKEMTLEGGALVLADMGICCIDEFDKMEEGDRTAIHEVMEQQTVSIAKAGITTTLNARTSVLAAANPIYGRYNKKLTASQNINLPNALLSRFDLLFLILDTAQYDKDEALARHVTYVHRFCKNPEMAFDPVRSDVLRYFIAVAKQYVPAIPESLCSYIVEAYVTLRQQQDSANDAQTAMTARQLLSILRLSQALARLRFSSTVVTADVDEAIRLVYVSKSSLQDEEHGAHGRPKSSMDANSKIYRLILDFARDRGEMSVNYSDIEPIVIRKGYTNVQLKACIEQYETLQVLQWSENKTLLHFVT
ncbi:minichromosome maintenance protein 7 (cell division control protein 47) [Saprolegnia diclina VS20]|uniref:DNA replication licensing factor MCM7 n=1 Tax=Saprolegnia diclina (strain VS20) TaxID=1156394 RepID=T0SFS1_SAPDV|nr:minichromosome maintenance protein 7 (cell division control protein 47) [Saprolegnia diclina VS20]EQC41872.1 minichromosome maintenance protein 7 (cell division control protein 47) [Saprolegnia diclina VS20]|eukprot:XP_008604441.1 minichromosome maintenance protein 7 (cell division control protein 47) [Saprolegnia diclina VS20]